MAIVWSTVFEESHTSPRATAAEIDQFVVTIGAPLSSTEIADVVRTQLNPFPIDDPRHNTWHPFEPSDWTVPRSPLPASYLDFLKWSNGGEFRSGERWFQFFQAIDPVHGVRAQLLAYNIPQHMPLALPFAFNGSGIFYLFDMRHGCVKGEYPVVGSEAGNLGWEPDQHVRIAESFLATCRGVRSVDDLLYGRR